MEPSKDNAVLLALEACKLDLPILLCQKLALLDFESRKDAAQVSFHAHHLAKNSGVQEEVSCLGEVQVWQTAGLDCSITALAELLQLHLQRMDCMQHNLSASVHLQGTK